MIDAIDLGSDRDVLSKLDALLRTGGWEVVDQRVRTRIDQCVQRIIQPDCPDRERSELAGEIRGLTYVVDFPRSEASAILERLT